MHMQGTTTYIQHAYVHNSQSATSKHATPIWLTCLARVAGHVCKIILKVRDRRLIHDFLGQFVINMHHATNESVEQRMLKSAIEQMIVQLLVMLFLSQ